MARISTYIKDTNLSSEDLLIGTDSDNAGATANFSLDAVADYVSQLLPTADWNTVFNWGDHSLAGYITSENDPVFTASTAYNISTENVSNWNTAFGWGDHATEGYLKNETLTSLSIVLNELRYVDEQGHTTFIDLSTYLDDTNLARIVSGNFDVNTGLATFTRDDNSTFTIDLSPLLGNTNTFLNAANFNAGTGLLTLTRNDSTQITVNLDNRYLTSFTELDPIFTASAAANITSINISNWDTAFGWGNHSTQGYLTSFTELDPVFTASEANNITAQNITDLGTLNSNYGNWDTAFGWGDHSAVGYLVAGDLNNAIGYAQTANEFKTSTTFTTDINFSSAAVFTKTLSGNTTLTFSNANIGMTKILLVTGGNGGYTLTFPTGATKLTGTYDDTVLNFIQVTCTGAGEYYYTISQPA